MPTFKLAAILALALTSQAFAEATPAPTLLPTLPVLASLSPTAALGVSSTASTQAPVSAQDVTRKAALKSGSPWIRSQAQLTRIGKLEEGGQLNGEQAATLRKNMQGIRSRYGLRKGKPNPRLSTEQRNRMEQELELEESRAIEARQP